MSENTHKVWSCNCGVQSSLAPAAGSHLRWHCLSTIHHGTQLHELLAASCDDGIGIIARWTRREGGGWEVEAMDTESAEGMQPVVEYHAGECVPPEPPTVFDDVNVELRQRGTEI